MALKLRGRIYHYDFKYAGQTYRGSTKQTDKRKAKTVENAERAKVASGERRNLAGHSVKDLFARYWREHGKKLKWAPTLAAHMDGLEAFFGANRRFAEITTKDLSDCLAAYAASTAR